MWQTAVFAIILYVTSQALSRVEDAIYFALNRYALGGKLINPK